MPTKLGQNFLKDAAVLKRIIETAGLSMEDAVIEIGPGKGVLTEELAKHCKKIIAVELDHELIAPLKNKFKNSANVEIIEGDILKINLPEVLRSYSASWRTTSYKLVANIPYYITAPIIRLFLETQYPPSEMILMVQKEVAERICGKAGEMSILAVAVQYYATPEILFEVSKNSFDPMPEVDSAVIRIKYNVSSIKYPEETKKFFRIVRAGFSAKRKTLANNLTNSLHLEKNIVEEKIIQLGLNKKIRAQELSVDDWKNLAKLF